MIAKWKLYCCRCCFSAPWRLTFCLNVCLNENYSVGCGGVCEEENLTASMIFFPGGGGELGQYLS